MRIAIVGTAILLVLSAAPVSAADVDHGKALYETCAACHTDRPRSGHVLLPNRPPAHQLGARDVGPPCTAAPQDPDRHRVSARIDQRVHLSRRHEKCVQPNTTTWV